SVFAKDFGRLELFGKAIRRVDSKLGANMEVFSFCQLEFIQGKNKKTLTDVLPLRKGKIWQHPEKFEVAGKMLSIFDDFMRGQELDPGMWDFIGDIFSKLNEAEVNHKFLYYYFFWNFISLLGYHPELAVCASCRGKLQPQALYFSHKEGGILCPSCIGGEKPVKKIDANSVKVLRLILKKDFETLRKLTVALSSKKLLKEITDGYLQYLLHSHAFNQNT